jgi:hypothetical protein
VTAEIIHFDDSLLVRVKNAVEALDTAEEAVEAAEEVAFAAREVVGSRSIALKLLLIEARKRYKVEEFAAFLKKVPLSQSRAYEIMTRTRVRRYRARRATKKSFSVTSASVTEKDRRSKHYLKRKLAVDRLLPLLNAADLEAARAYIVMDDWRREPPPHPPHPELTKH